MNVVTFSPKKTQETYLSDILTFIFISFLPACSQWTAVSVAPPSWDPLGPLDTQWNCNEIVPLVPFWQWKRKKCVLYYTKLNCTAQWKQGIIALWHIWGNVLKSECLFSILYTCTMTFIYIVCMWVAWGTVSVWCHAIHLISNLWLWCLISAATYQQWQGSKILLAKQVFQNI